MVKSSESFGALYCHEYYAYPPIFVLACKRKFWWMKKKIHLFKKLCTGARYYLINIFTIDYTYVITWLNFIFKVEQAKSEIRLFYQLEPNIKIVSWNLFLFTPSDLIILYGFKDIFNISHWEWTLICYLYFNTQLCNRMTRTDLFL